MTLYAYYHIKASVESLFGIKTTLYYSIILSFALGHVDLLVRISRRYFEWFEVYLALIMPLAVIIPLFLLLFVVTRIVFELGYDLRSFLVRFYKTSSLVIPVVVLFEAVINSPSLLLNSIFKGYLFEYSFLVLLLGAILFIYFLGKGQKHWEHPGKISLKLNGIIKNYAFFVSVFCLISFLLDVYYSTYIPDYKNATDTLDKPNIILITLDTTRADHLTPYGYGKNTTPNLERLTEKSALFENAVSSSPWTLPSHASIFTGKWVYQHHASNHHQILNDYQTTLAELLKKNGYLTAGFVGGPYCKAKYGIAQGFDFYSDRLDFFEYSGTWDKYSIRRILDFFSSDLRYFFLRADGERHAPEINRDVFRWLDKSKSQPFFLFINYFDSHYPYNLGSSLHLKGKYTKQDADILHEQDVGNAQGRYYPKKNIDPEFIAYLKGLYDEELRFLDHHLGNLMDKLKNEGYLKNTALIITSDHGEEFLEHGGVEHKITLYREVLHVPLIIHLPGVDKPKRISKTVGLIDIFATIADLVPKQAN